MCEADRKRWKSKCHTYLWWDTTWPSQISLPEAHLRFSITFEGAVDLGGFAEMTGCVDALSLTLTLKLLSQETSGGNVCNCVPAKWVLRYSMREYRMIKRQIFIKREKDPKHRKESYTTLLLDIIIFLHVNDDSKSDRAPYSKSSNTFIIQFFQTNVKCIHIFTDILLKTDIQLYTEKRFVEITQFNRLVPHYPIKFLT